MTDIWEEAMRSAIRKKNEFYAVCAHIDLLGMKEAIFRDREQAQSLIDNLYESLYYTFDLYKTRKEYKVCFFGDSVTISLEIESKSNVLGELKDLSVFLIKALGDIRHLDEWFEGNGLRAFISHGKLIPLSSSIWKESSILSPNVRFLDFTGINEAFARCVKADDQGSKNGFLHHHIWIEVEDEFVGLDLREQIVLDDFNTNVNLFDYLVLEKLDSLKKAKLENYPRW